MDVALNWLWQGALIAAATALALRAIGEEHTRARYRLVWAAILSVTLVPFFHNARVYTAYEYLERRFDAKTRAFTSLLFLLSRSMSLGVVSKVLEPWAGKHDQPDETHRVLVEYWAIAEGYGLDRALCRERQLHHGREAVRFGDMRDALAIGRIQQRPPGHLRLRTPLASVGAENAPGTAAREFLLWALVVRGDLDAHKTQ